MHAHAVFVVREFGRETESRDSCQTYVVVMREMVTTRGPKRRGGLKSVTNGIKYSI